MSTNARTGHHPRRRRALGSLVAIIALATLGLAACGGDDDDTASTTTGGGSETSGAPAGGLLGEARENGITIGIANERPYGYEEGGEATGEAPELAKEILSRLEIDQVDFEVVEFGALINGLNASRFDVIAAGMFINPERAEQVLFADPDYCGTTAFAVADGNPLGLTDFESVTTSGARLGVLAGAVEEGYATGSGIPAAQISPFQTTPDVFDALAAGRIDAVALTAVTVREQVADLEGFEATEGFVPVVNGEEQLGCGAFAFRYENEDFRDAFNEVLNEMQANDEVLPIIEPFGFTSVEVDAAEDVTVEDLAEASPATTTTAASTSTSG
ncbi:MAG: ectoine/hydroxyectoine ABC transporter substrate-binding protein EhuB [Acidimicrobiia bacterium]|nr:ectoine/hydroxyectoine ABC transporter substrate-binding protein EhuB [Acidimicrobiia bacterium]